MRPNLVAGHHTPFRSAPEGSRPWLFWKIGGNTPTKSPETRSRQELLSRERLELYMVHDPMFLVEPVLVIECRVPIRYTENKRDIFALDPQETRRS